MANRDFKYFYEDEVFRVTKKGSLQFGMVIENAEFHSSDESSDEEEPAVKAGQVRVAWYPSGAEEVVTEKKVHLADRSLMPGDVVRRLVAGRSTQRGYCRAVTVHSSVQVIGTSQVIFGAKASLLTPLEAFKADVLICLDSWVGMVRNVRSRLTLRFPDGSKVTVDDEVADELEDIRDKRDPECEFKRYDFYPGQVLYGAVRQVEAGAWGQCSPEVAAARRTRPTKAFKMTVEDIDFQSLGVSWICRAYFSSTSEEGKAGQPKYKVEGEALQRVRMLNVFEPCTVQIGDRNFYTLQEHDIVMMKAEWKRLQKEELMVESAKAKEGKAKEGKAKAEETKEEAAVAEEHSSDFEDVEEAEEGQASDASASSAEPAEGRQGASLTRKKPKSQAGLMTKVLKKKKLRKTRRAPAAGVLAVRPGDRVVTETLATRSEVEVVWQDGTVEQGVPSRELYPIHHLDDHEFFPGDFVTEARDGFHPHSYGVVQEVDHAGRCCRVKWFRTYTEGAAPQPIYCSTSDASVYDLKDHPDFKYRPGSIVIRVMNKAGDDCGLGAGQVLENQPSGQVHVWWAAAAGEGVRSSCWPQDLYKVGEYDSDDGELWDDDEEEDDVSGNDSWETESEQEVEEEVGEELLHTDAQDLKPKLAANIEKARVAMTRLEEIFGENETLQTADVMRQLLDVYRDCRQLDRLMGTFYFDESNFGGLLDRIRDQDRISSMEAAVKDHVSRLFSVEEESEASPGKDSGVGSSPAAPGPAMEEVPDSRVCGRLCAMIKTQLIKSHEEVVRRFGSIEAAPAAAQQEMQEDVEEEVSFQTPTKEKAPSEEKMEVEEAPSTPRPTSPSTPCTPAAPDTSPPLSPGSFQMVEAVPDSHKFKLTLFQPNNMKTFLRTVRSEIRLLQSSLPPGIVVKGFEERLDLFSAVIHGPRNTPYEGGLFFFDFQLPAEYPAAPPAAHYISFCSDRLNPNLYEDGKVCVSLLGTWQGRGSETWSAGSNLLQLLVSIQGLILVREPYFNEAGYEKQKGAQQGSENSRMYNEMAVLKLVQSMTRLVRAPHPPFQAEVRAHFAEHGAQFVERLLRWRAISVEHNASLAATPTSPGAFSRQAPGLDLPDFPLVPASKGFCLTLDKSIRSLQEAMAASQELPLD